MTGDVSGSQGESVDYSNIISAIAGAGQRIHGYIQGYQQLFGGQERGSGRMAARGAAALAAALQRQTARVAAKQFAFAQAQQFPESPVYGPQAVITQYDVKPRLATRQTNILQKLMTHPDSKHLQAKLTKIDAKIARSIARHPEFATQYAVTRKY